MRKKLSTADTPIKMRIAEAAKLLFSQKGYLGTSIEDIIEASESSKGNLYHHFNNKEGLFLYLVQQQVAQWLEQWAAKRIEYATFTETLYGLAAHVAMDLQNPLSQAAEEFSGSETAKPEVLQKIYAEIRKQREVITQIVREGIEGGYIKSGYALEDLTAILYALLGGLGAARHEYTMDKLIELHRTAITAFLQGVASNTSSVNE